MLLLAALHTHSAPSFLPFGSAPVRDSSGAAYQAELERRIFSAVEQASKIVAPAKLVVGRGSIQLGYNRLIPQSDGRSRVAYRNPERIPYGPVDPEFVLLRVDDMTGHTRAMLPVRPATCEDLIGSIPILSGPADDLFSTGERWEADAEP